MSSFIRYKTRVNFTHTESEQSRHDYFCQSLGTQEVLKVPESEILQDFVLGTLTFIPLIHPSDSYVCSNGVILLNLVVVVEHMFLSHIIQVK